MSSARGAFQAGRYRTTGESRATRPDPTSCIRALVVPMTLVSDARSQMVVADGRDASRISRRPTPYSAMTPSAVPTAAYPPGNALSEIARVSTARTLSPNRRACSGVMPGTAGAASEAAARFTHPMNTLATQTNVNIDDVRRLKKARFSAFVQVEPPSGWLTGWADRQGSGRVMCSR